MNSKVSYAVAVILSGVSLGASAAQSASDSGATDNSLETLGEITVTAQRRVESMQDVPISMQAFTAESLQELNVSTFDDYIKDLPNVTSANNGPGQNEVFMRGLSAGSQASQGSASTGLWPNVAIYLDNQSGQLPNRNLDIYAADLERIEVLEGPQGTLFGAGAEAGVIRYITNEPKLNTTEGNVKAGYGFTTGGDPNANLTAVLNLPIIEDHMAVRAVVYEDRHGGYINNVPATFTRRDTDIGISYGGYPAVNGACPDGQPNNGYCVPPGSPSINNYSLAGTAINPATYEGLRVEALYKFNDDWDLLISQSYQSLDTQGVFYQQPNASDGQALRPLEVTTFNPAFDKDRFESTAWTLNGVIGPVKAVYTGGYLDRKVDQQGDYTNYSRGVYADYYQCYGGNGLNPTCFSPSAYWQETERNTHMQHELRFSTPDDWRARGIIGAFYEDNTLYDQTGWHYKSVPTCTATLTAGCFADISPFPGTTVQNPGLQSNDTSFYQDTKRETRQTAFFLSADYDIIPKVLTATVGTRHFLFLNSYQGSVLSSFGCFDAGVPAGGCHSPLYSYNLNADHLSDSEGGWKSRANLTWHVTRDAMVYYTFSQGFRPGGFNQNVGAQHIPGPDGNNQYAIPRSYSSDKLTNNEIGWKTEWFDHRLQFNGALYQENWNDVQISFFQPNLVGNLFFNTNGQNFVVRGAETSLIARPIAGLSIQGAASWNHSRQTNSPALIDNVPGSVNYGKAITQLCNGTTCSPVTNPFGPIGSPTADAPPIQYNAHIRYDWFVGSYQPFIQFGGTHQGHAYTQAGSNPTLGSGPIETARLRFEIAPYSTFDASIGVSKDKWYFKLYGENLTNSNASTFVSTDQFIVAETPLRPRVVGGEFGVKF